MILPYDAQDRADIGRSTFYAHYTDKSDLLMSEIARMIEFLDAHAKAGAHSTCIRR